MFKKIRQSLLDNIVAPSQLNLAGLKKLLLPVDRSPVIRRHIASVIMARVQLIAGLFALLVPLGAIVDLLVFDSATAGRLVVLRLLSAALFVALAWPRVQSASKPYTQAMGMLLTLLIVPPLFHLFSASALQAAADQNEVRQLLVHLYGYLPTVVLGGLAVFPLTALETLLLALPVVITAMASQILLGIPFSLAEDGGALWFMLMMLGVAMFSGMSQSHYIATLVFRAMHDTLTGAYTRQSGEEAIKLLHQLSSMSGNAMCIAFVDLDYFKSVNDQYGHKAGDQVLQQMAERLRANLRRSDVLVRWGGEEFLAVLPDTPPENLPLLFKRLQEQGVGNRPDGTPLTASVGVACSTEEGIDNWPALISRADMRMYQAKEQGRNRVMLPDGEVRPFV